MAKKKAAKATKASAAKSPKKAPKKAPAKKKPDQIEIELSPAEAQAYELAHSSEEVCHELELAVTMAMAQAVRKVFKKHDISLTEPQSQQIAMILFGD